MFITFDGPDGSGKSVLRNKLAARLGDNFDIDDKILYHKEPGVTSLGSSIRRLLLDNNTDVTPKAELFLYLADRASHYEKMLKEDLEEEYIVMCDRYFESTYVYQHLIREVIDKKEFMKLHEIATDGLKPDLSFIIYSKDSHSTPEDRMDYDMMKHRKKLIKSYKEIQDETYFDYPIHYIDTTKGNWDKYVDEMQDVTQNFLENMYFLE